jgi:hypothetical protein
VLQHTVTLVKLVCQFFSIPAQPKVSIGHLAWIDGAIMAENIYLIANSTERFKRNVKHGNYKGEFVASRRQIATTSLLMSVRPSVGLLAWNIVTPKRRIYMKFNIWNFY